MDMAELEDTEELVGMPEADQDHQCHHPSMVRANGLQATRSHTTCCVISR